MGSSRYLLAVGMAFALLPQAAAADGVSMAGSLWRCTRENDRAQIIITFHPGGGVGGGELRSGKVIPYIFDATNVRDDEWPGRWEVKEQDFTWDFPDQHLRIEGTVSKLGMPNSRLSGTLTASGDKMRVTCTGLTRLPPFGDGYVVPRDGHFVDPDDSEGELKVPAGVSLPEPGSRR